MTSIRFKSLSSGSCGNCYFLGIFEDNNCSEAILIDAGVSPRRLKKELSANAIQPDCIMAMLITHDHLDHIRSLGSFCKHHSFPVWTTKKLCNALSIHFICKDYFSQRKRVLDSDWNQISPNIKVKYFIVPHDASQTVGYAIDILGYKFTIMTDIGAMTSEALSFASQSNTVVIESNYDGEMLCHGGYPKVLQDRIRGGNGHLSNDECAQSIASFLSDNLKSVFLCHLSEHNNSPRLAQACSRAVLPGQIRLVTLPRQTASNLFILKEL